MNKNIRPKSTFKDLEMTQNKCTRQDELILSPFCLFLWGGGGLTTAFYFIVMPKPTVWLYTGDGTLYRLVDHRVR